MNLSKHGIMLDTLCIFCHYGLEFVYHLFLQCDFAKQIFFSSILGYKTPKALDINDSLLNCLKYIECFNSQLVCTLLWKIQNARNEVVYQKKHVTMF